MCPPATHQFGHEDVDCILGLVLHCLLGTCKPTALLQRHHCTEYGATVVQHKMEPKQAHGTQTILCFLGQRSALKDLSAARRTRPHTHSAEPNAPQGAPADFPSSSLCALLQHSTSSTVLIWWCAACSGAWVAIQTQGSSSGCERHTITHQSQPGWLAELS